MKSYSVVDKEKFESLKEDIKGSLNASIDNMFAGAHVVSINTSASAIYVTAEYVNDKGAKKTDVLWFDSLMFRE